MVLFLPSVETGGVERNAVYVANGMVNRGFDVYLLYCRKQDAWFARLDSRVQRIQVRRPARIPILHERLVDALGMLLFGPAALRAITRGGPTAIVSFQSNIIAITLALLCRLPIAVRLSNHFVAVRHERSLLRTVSEIGKRLTYRLADRVVANSSELAKDYAQVLGRGVQTIPNPIDFARIQRLQDEEVPESLFRHRNRPIVITAGRLAQQKNYPLLLRAMADVVKNVPCDLVILGEGSERESLESLVRELGLEGFVHLPGYKENVYKYFRRADLFVLSSNYEGMPNVLIEAIACGLPAVATRCKTGPEEILCGGQGGELAAVGDSEGLGSAIVRALTERAATDRKRAVAASHVRRYDLAVIEEQYAHLVEEMLPAE